MANQPTSFRFPFKLPKDLHPQVDQAIRYAFTGLKDHTDAINALNEKVGANTAAVTSVTTVVNSAAAASGGGGSSPATFGFVNSQPNLTPGVYSLAQTDLGGLILVQSGIAFALSLNSGLTVPFFTTVYNLGAGLVTATPSAGLVNGAASIDVATNQFAIFFWDGANWWAVSTPSGPSFADAITPPETVDGINTVFTLPQSPSPAASLELFDNGILQYPVLAYALSGNTVTFVVAPLAGHVLIAWYRY